MPRAATLPSSEVLAGWTPEQIYNWGEASWRWGKTCAELLEYNRVFRECEKGDVPSCTLAGQLVLGLRE